MITQETALNVLNDFLSHRLGREVSTEETEAALRALENGFKTLKIFTWPTGLKYAAVLLIDGPNCLFTTAKTESKTRKQALDLARDYGYTLVDFEDFPDGDAADERIVELLRTPDTVKSKNSGS